MICILTISRVTGEIKFRRQLGIAVRSSDSRSRLVGFKLYLCCLKAPWLQTSNLPCPYHWFLIWNREKGKILCSILHLILAKRPRRDSERDGNTRPPGLPLDKPVCRLEATVRTGHGTTDWFQIGKGVCQGRILSPCSFNLYAEYIMRNAGLEEAQAGVKIAGKNINNLRYANNTTLMAESKEERQSLLMKVKEKSESQLA